MTIPAKASILAIGTELTSGQITNRNAAWISEKLVNLGIEVVLHETVADDRKMIRHALDHCATMSPLLFVTGGLGPTSDDFTREVIAEWLNQPLEFDEGAWQKVIERLNRFGIRIAESNRQQCFFPRGSTILPNPNGTAAGFTSEFSSPASAGKIWVFPGPPNEVNTVWDQGVPDQLKLLLPRLTPLRLFTWQCMGKSEADLGEITETTLSGSGLQTGYRAHRPFVEVKVWCPESTVNEKLKWIEKLDTALSPWLMTRQGEDLGTKLLRKLNRTNSIEIFDAASGGTLAQRLGFLFQNPQYQDQAQATTLVTEWASCTSPELSLSETFEHADEESITLALTGFTYEGICKIGFKEHGRVYSLNYQSLYRNPELIDRRKHEIVEVALKYWCEWLDTTTN